MCVQVKKAGGDASRQAEQAESLLLANRPFTDLLGSLPLLVSICCLLLILHRVLSDI